MSRVHHTAHVHHGAHPLPPGFALPLPLPSPPQPRSRPSEMPPPHPPPPPHRPPGPGPINYQNYFNPYLPQHVHQHQPQQYSGSSSSQKGCIYNLLALCFGFMLLLILYALLSRSRVNHN